MSRYARSSTEMIFDWLSDLGVRFSERLLQMPGNSVPRFHTPHGRGLGLVRPVYLRKSQAEESRDAAKEASLPV